VENVLFKSGGNDLRDRNIVLTDNKIVQGPEIADHALATLLTLTRRLNLFMRDQKEEQRQPPRPFPGIELRTVRTPWSLAWVASAARSRYAPGPSA
jgi:lactate dehydrogenase-like 2-hydroxyacid dehydrogenase